MTIDTELSSEIAAALLTAKDKSAHELKNLKETVIKVHSTLQELAAKSRRHRLASHASREADRRN